MARSPRRLTPGGVYHVTSRGNERRPIARDDQDWVALSRLLEAEVEQRRWQVLTFCFMPNHLHLLVRIPAPDLSDGLQVVLGDYAAAFNRRHDRTGHLFQGRFYSDEVTNDAHLTELFRYIALNPVRAGLAPVPELWRWSAHLALLGLADPPRFLHRSLDPFAGDVGAYAAFVRDGGSSYLADLLATTSPDRLRLALEAGFSTRQVAAALGVSKEAVLRRAKGV